MADMKISDLPEASNVNDAQQFEVNDSGNSRRVTFQQIRGQIKQHGDNDYAAKTHTHTAEDISDATLIGQSLMKAIDPVAARGIIGAGTSNLVLGTTADTAKPGDWVPDLAAIPGNNPVFAQYTAGTNFNVGALPAFPASKTNGWYFPPYALRATSSGTVRIIIQYIREVIVRRNGVDVLSWNSLHLAWAQGDFYVNYGDTIQVGIRRNSNNSAIVTNNIYFKTASVAPIMIYTAWDGSGSLATPTPPSPPGNNYDY